MKRVLIAAAWLVAAVVLSIGARGFWLVLAVWNIGAWSLLLGYRLACWEYRVTTLRLTAPGSASAEVLGAQITDAIRKQGWAP